MSTLPDPHAGTPVQHAGADLRSASAAVVLVHGRGSSPADILGLARAVDRPDVAFLAPQAAGAVWYPQSFLAPLGANEPFLSSALRAVERAVTMAEGAGLPPERIVLGGFSQGACLALESAARSGRRLGGVVGFSGGLLGTVDDPDAPPALRGVGGLYADKRFDYAARLDGVPVLLRCSDVDPHIPLARVERTAEVFRALGAAVDLRVSPGGGHTVEPEGLAAFRSLVATL
jgi:phospholipase/carboxylesterase